ncbi:hypothetical protein [Neorhizobium galegae]|uniref:hypothetical protein n=1 Tax=Neorhizobium galegae TaxID=399 RepID=UPI0006213119|nr:hypothetical protein [Neorhizobium galegae]KAB1126311.1 hypothetical protein F4V90_04135 [Neorhizobium galegae]MCQ1805283.1 hypothetical protein [Neorhizobium galegae]CDZ56044.1 Appr-1-p processing domain-containing protein [Neorhizobium galegae bv. orientalis]
MGKDPVRVADGEPRETCFVVGPIGEPDSTTRRHADWLLKGIIQPVFSEHFRQFDVVRSDTITAPGMIDVQMITHLIDADLVIADMSERNPNAFYEMGIRHMTQKPIVHMFAEGTIIPFDVAPYRAIKFSIDRFENLQTAKEELRATVSETLRPGFEVQNPVTRARGVQAIEAKASPEIQVLYQEIADIRRELKSKDLPNTGPTLTNIFLRYTLPVDMAKLNTAIMDMTNPLVVLSMRDLHDSRLELTVNASLEGVMWDGVVNRLGLIPHISEVSLLGFPENGGLSVALPRGISRR